MKPALVAGFVGTAVAGLVVGYFTGREAFRQEMTNNFLGVMSGISNIGRQADSTFSSISTEMGKEVAPVKPALPAPFGIALKAKDFETQGYQDAITFAIEFDNRTGQDIRAFDGVLSFTDLLDNELMAARIAVNDVVKAGGTTLWEGQIDYNQFMDHHRSLRAADFEDLKIAFKPGKVLFGSGETQTYN